MITFPTPGGRPVDAVPPAPRWRSGSDGPRGSTIARLSEAGVVLGPRTPLSPVNDEPMDVAWVIDVLRGHDPIDARPGRGPEGACGASIDVMW